jgi:hypothetical protein
MERGVPGRRYLLGGESLTGRPPKATVTGVRLTRRTMHFDSLRSLAALDLTPRPIRQSLAVAVAWLRPGDELSIACLGRGAKKSSGPIAAAPSPDGSALPGPAPLFAFYRAETGKSISANPRDRVICETHD